MIKATHVDGRRTVLRAGKEAAYESIHAAIPEPVAAALRECGVIRWHIWRDGSQLFHSVETTSGYAQMAQQIAARGPIDPDWDELIAGLLDAASESDVILPLVWSMDALTQVPGHSKAQQV